MILVRFQDSNLLLNEEQFERISYNDKAETLTVHPIKERRSYFGDNDENTYCGVKYIKRVSETDNLEMSSTIFRETAKQAEENKFYLKNLKILLEHALEKLKLNLYRIDKCTDIDEIKRILNTDRDNLAELVNDEVLTKATMLTNSNYVNVIRMLKNKLEATLRPQIEAEIRPKLEADLRQIIRTEIRIENETADPSTLRQAQGPHNSGTAVDKPTDPRLGRAAKHASFNPLDYIINHMRRNHRPNIE